MRCTSQLCTTPKLARDTGPNNAQRSAEQLIAELAAIREPTPAPDDVTTPYLCARGARRDRLVYQRVLQRQLQLTRRRRLPGRPSQREESVDPYRVSCPVSDRRTKSARRGAARHGRTAPGSPRPAWRSAALARRGTARHDTNADDGRAASRHVTSRHVTSRHVTA